MPQALRPVGTATTCPYKRCPGIYQDCGGHLVPQRGADGLERWLCHACDFATYGVQQVQQPWLALELLPPPRNRAIAVCGSAGADAACEGAEADAPSMPAQACTLGSAPSTPVKAVLSDAAKSPAAAAPVRCDGGSQSPVSALSALGRTPPRPTCVAPTDTAYRVTGARPEQLQASKACEPMLVVKALSSTTYEVARHGGVAQLLQRRAGVDLSAAVATGPEEVRFPLSQYESLAAQLKAAKLLDLTASCIPEWALASARGAVPRTAPEEVEAAMERMPRELRLSLMPFQVEGVRFGLERGTRCLIGDEMGAPPPRPALPTHALLLWSRYDLLLTF